MTKFILTCEHGGNLIPAKYQQYFNAAGKELRSHRGYDPGALDLFFRLQHLADFSHYSKVSRLLVELNRSLHHPRLFSKTTTVLPHSEKMEILNKYYFPYRDHVIQKIEEFTRTSFVVHISVHSFTPQLDDEIRNNDIGLLYNPAVEREKEICAEWKKLILERNSNLKVRFNFPYRGTADGFTTFLRKRFKNAYAGIELEVNQKHVRENSFTSTVVQIIVESITELKQKRFFEDASKNS